MPFSKRFKYIDSYVVTDLSTFWKERRKGGRKRGGEGRKGGSRERRTGKSGKKESWKNISSVSDRVRGI